MADTTSPKKIIIIRQFLTSVDLTDLAIMEPRIKTPARYSAYSNSKQLQRTNTSA